jgi:hypothetical protein
MPIVELPASPVLARQLKVTWSLGVEQELNKLAESVERGLNKLTEKHGTMRLEPVDHQVNFDNMVCQGCGYGLTDLGVVLVTRPKFIVLSVKDLCPMCQIEINGGKTVRQPGDPVLSPR